MPSAQLTLIHDDDSDRGDTLGATDNQLTALIAAWPSLPQATRDGILLIAGQHTR